MKKIKLTEIKKPQKGNYIKHNMYSVYLGNSTVEYFTSLKAAKNYLAAANKFLNFNLVQVNDLLAAVYVEYRKFWFSFYDKNGHNYKKLESDLVYHLEQANNFINYSWQKSTLPNGNNYAFMYQFRALSSLRTSVELLQRLTRNKNLMYDFNRLEVLRQRIIYAYRCLELYPKPNDNKIINLQP
jgi:hypothetical protein